MDSYFCLKTSYAFVMEEALNWIESVAVTAIDKKRNVKSVQIKLIVYEIFVLLSLTPEWRLQAETIVIPRSKRDSELINTCTNKDVFFVCPPKLDGLSVNRKLSQSHNWTVFCYEAAHDGQLVKDVEIHVGLHYLKESNDFSPAFRQPTNICLTGSG